MLLCFTKIDLVYELLRTLGGFLFFFSHRIKFSEFDFV
ncbi:MAG: hypothetical protein QG623_662 [Patescibacteria group bacterium]|nr:hypothetical protein [Patescibacteria group bacterium]